MKKILFCLVSVMMISSVAFSFEAVSTCDLLMSYLENDNDLKKNAIDAQKAQLSLDSTKISQGFDITLSTGSISISSDGDNLNMKVNPSVKATVPQASNLSLSASSNFAYKDSESKIEDAKLNASIDIISSNGLNREISLMEAERNLTEAKRKLQNQAITSEKAFYTELKNLLNSTSSIINAQKNLYNDKMDFEKIKAQGYSTGSSTYRLAQMKVLSDEHSIEISSRSLIHDYVIFYKKCGYDISIEDTVDFYELIPQDITEIEPLDIHSFDENLYSEIESALWKNKINSLKRKAKSNFTLSANGGVTFNNTVTESTTIDTGISTSFFGVDLGAGVSFPVASESIPSFNFSATFKPNTLRQNAITEQSDALSEKQELLEIETARSNFATKVVECEQSLVDLEWTKNSDQEALEMYEALEKDLLKWYKDGFVTESEYYSAKVNCQYYSVKKIINAINYIIYNDNLVTMFVEEI